ncbi:coiled-coil domain-containing protein 190 [Emydura macquarii macquarii]|uniref:coiled-coil domain-containing protein 190 n=1 Tax=Emydura macquarii macquarii TaxID=1129001 RepID=UPI00352AA99F
MHRSKTSVAEGDSARRWELERRDVKRAEVRLSHGLQDLEEARHYHMNSMIREQKQIQKELLRLQQGNSRKKAHETVGDISQEAGKRAALPTLPPSSGQQHSDSRAERLRALKSTLPKMEVPTQAAQSTLQYQTCDIIDGAWQKSSGRPGSTATRTQANTRSFITDMSLPDLRHSIAKRLSISASPAEQEETNSPGELDKDPKEEAEVSDAMPKPPRYTGRRMPSLVHEKLSFDTDAHTLNSRSGFLELYAEARKARYIRHNGIPASERELSLREIFGHEDSLDSNSAAAKQEQHSPE